MKPRAFIPLLLLTLMLTLSGSRLARAIPQAEEKILVSISNDTVGWSDDTLYTLNPDGTGQTQLYNFHSHPKLTTGEVWAPRISASGQYIYFHSEHAYAYTPARRNAFRVASDGSGLDQITPGEKSGVWGETGNSTVSGWVQKSNGDPYVNAPVYLEGMSSTYSGADGSFSFQNVPVGLRWLVAYRPGDSPFDSTTVNVISGVDNPGITLTPNSTWRSNFEYPVAYGSRIYYQTNSVVQWTDLSFSSQNTVYTPSNAGCVTSSPVKAFDAAPTSGKLAVFDHHGDGCTNNVGLYITDKDGGNKQVLLNMWTDTDWSESLLPVEIFWSPDESKIAFQGIYAWWQVLVIIDANTGAILGDAFADTGSQTLTLHGWNPGGDWLLFSSYDGDRTQTTLSKVKINADGSFDLGSVVNLISNQPINGATWGQLNASGGGSHKIYLPLVVR